MKSWKDEEKHSTLSMSIRGIRNKGETTSVSLEKSAKPAKVPTPPSFPPPKRLLGVRTKVKQQGNKVAVKKESPKHCKVEKKASGGDEDSDNTKQAPPVTPFQRLVLRRLLTGGKLSSCSLKVGDSSSGSSKAQLKAVAAPSSSGSSKAQLKAVAAPPTPPLRRRIHLLSWLQELGMVQDCK